MKFAHLADCHVGGWREEKLNKLSIGHFKRAIDLCLEENVGFVLISGDLFDVAMPGYEVINEVAKQLARLREDDVSVYIIPGSHDYSATGKTALSILESADLCVNACKFNDDKLQIVEDKTGVKISGMLGRRGGLEKEDYKRLERKHLENENGFKIFMFHTALEEFKPKDLDDVECTSYLDLPKNFSYYAGGHVHYLFDVVKEGYGKIVYPGPLFPNNFKEIEELKKGSFCIVDDKLNVERRFLELGNGVMSFSVSGFSPSEINFEIEKIIGENEFSGKIVTLRISGELENGKISDVKVREFAKRIEEKGALYVLKNTNKLKMKEFEEIKLQGEVKDIEKELIKGHLGQFKIEREQELTEELIELLSQEKLEGETNALFETRIINAVLKSLKLEI
ncbi:DNA repair exonuclease [Candidatus Woesearchaeota archaeon]|nr:DNA repair exonuclease [Candidatus Woesearchaeota archaeon]